MKLIGTSDHTVDFWERVPVPFTHGTCSRELRFGAPRASLENSSESRCWCTTQQELNYNDL